MRKTIPLQAEELDATQCSREREGQHNKVLLYFCFKYQLGGIFFFSVRTKTTCSKNTVSLHAKPALIFLLFLPGLRLVIIT